MALTRSFGELVQRRIAADPAYGEALLLEGWKHGGGQIDTEAFVDQKPHDPAMASSLRRPRSTGC
jgi:hypothetical protein